MASHLVSQLLRSQAPLHLASFSQRRVNAEQWSLNRRTEADPGRGASRLAPPPNVRLWR
jgi:hypothetical protein